MKIISRNVIIGIGLWGFSVASFSQEITFHSKDLRLEVNEKGYYQSVKVVNRELLNDKPSPIITGCKNGELTLPVEVKMKGQKLLVTMSDNATVELKCLETPSCITIEADRVPSGYDALVFGPLQVKINEVVGDVVGVVQGNGVAIGMQSLNIKTMAGIPEEYAGIIQKKFQVEGKSAELSVGTIDDSRLAAIDMKEGASFQLYCRNRTQAAERKIFGLENMRILPVEGEDALIGGAKMTIWGSEQEKALERIGTIEVEQGLPHPTFDGEWGKTARQAMRSYLITEFSEENFDFILDKAERAGFKYVYHSGPFQDWGHFNWSTGVTASGDEGMADLVTKAAQRGISVGIHTLTNFTTTNDAYVTPIPTEHLLKQGTLELVSDLDAAQKEITIKKSGYFKLPMTLNGLMIDKELITFGSFKEEGNNMVLTNCTRGAFGTVAAAHDKKTPFYKLWDYPYGTFFPDLELQDEYVDRLIDIFNKTGLKQISFDGLEGCMYTGHEDYSTSRFVERFYKGVKHNVLNDASRLNHFNWHIHTRMNWGEPWGEAMRTGQVENRIKNQKFFQRNLFPRMLGWFLIRLADNKFECTTLEDLEWALSESAGFDAGYAMTINVHTLKNHGQIDKLLATIKDWDMLRERQCFSAEQRERLKKVETEWHLEKVSEREFYLYPLAITKHYRCSMSEMQPGQPGGADWTIDTPYGGNYAFRLKVKDGKIVNPSFKTDDGVISFPCTIEDGQYLLFDQDGKATITDKNFNVISKVDPQGEAKLPVGSSHIAFSCRRQEATRPDIEVRFITRGIPEIIMTK